MKEALILEIWMIEDQYSSSRSRSRKPRSTRRAFLVRVRTRLPSCRDLGLLGWWGPQFKVQVAPRTLGAWTLS
jgi:hypothetical protein